MSFICFALALSARENGQRTVQLKNTVLGDTYTVTPDGKILEGGKETEQPLRRGVCALGRAPGNYFRDKTKTAPAIPEVEQIATNIICTNQYSI
jgi:hypothetical protein